MATTQPTLDRAALALLQERLDRGHTWRQIAAKVHGLPEPERNRIGDLPELLSPASSVTSQESGYYDRWQAEQRPPQSPEYRPAVQQPPQSPEYRPAVSRILDVNRSETPSASPPVAPPIAIGGATPPAAAAPPATAAPLTGPAALSTPPLYSGGAGGVPASGWLRQYALPLAAAGGIAASGAVVYLWPRTVAPTPAATPAIAAQPTTPVPDPSGSLLEALRQRGYHLPPSEARPK